MAGQYSDNVIRRLTSRLGRQAPAPDPDLGHGDARFDAFARSLMVTPSRRGALRLVAGLTVAGLIGWRPAEVVEAHNFLKSCQKITNKAKRKRCIKRAKSHNASHRKKKRGPNASCIVEATQVTGHIIQERNAQTFTEPNGGKLDAVQLILRNGLEMTGTHYLLQVNTVYPTTGYPTNDTIASTQLPSSLVGTTPTLVTFFFATPATLVAGRQYALVVSRPVGSSTHHLPSQDPGTCAGGEMFYSTSLTGAFFPFGVPSVDMPYVTFVSP